MSHPAGGDDILTSIQEDALTSSWVRESGLRAPTRILPSTSESEVVASSTLLSDMTVQKIEVLGGLLQVISFFFVHSSYHVSWIVT